MNVANITKRLFGKAPGGKKSNDFYSRRYCGGGQRLCDLKETDRKADSGSHSITGLLKPDIAVPTIVGLAIGCAAKIILMNSALPQVDVAVFVVLAVLVAIRTDWKGQK